MRNITLEDYVAEVSNVRQPKVIMFVIFIVGILVSFTYNLNEGIPKLLKDRRQSITKKIARWRCKKYFF